MKRFERKKKKNLPLQLSKLSCWAKCQFDDYFKQKCWFHCFFITIFKLRYIWERNYKQWIKYDTYSHMHTWSLELFSQDYYLASHSTDILCVNFLNEWWKLQFKVDPERQIFEKFFHGRFIYSHGVFFSTKKCAFYLKKLNFAFVS